MSDTVIQHIIGVAIIAVVATWICSLINND